MQKNNLQQQQHNERDTWETYAIKLCTSYIPGMKESIRNGKSPRASFMGFIEVICILNPVPQPLNLKNLQLLHEKLDVGIIPSKRTIDYLLLNPAKPQVFKALCAAIEDHIDVESPNKCSDDD